ncbi:MAG: HpsJ family protein, partial [Oscillatoria sp. Prado101]|nr:HpsJ family protein [Oscillatoria sp. Prado101]
WVSLLLALLCLLLIPPGLAYTVQINNQNNQQIAAQVAGQLKQLEEVETQVSKGTPQDIQNLASQLNNLGLQVDSQKPEEVRGQILEKVTAAKKGIEPQAQATRSNLRTALLKNSVKWNLGALISSALFFTIWRSTGWTRRRRGY